MSKFGTVRERTARASEYFHNRDGVILTTFNLSSAFLEDRALPTVLAVEAATTEARRAELHQRLGVTPCSVFYDPSSLPRISGRFRYVAIPVPVRGRFFHPKLVIIAGRAADGRTWVYLAVSSANLTLSGWGRNVESFGETWIHTRRQQSWNALDEFLAWLADRSPFGEGETPAESDAVSRVRAALSRMPDEELLVDDGECPWSGTLSAAFYVSIVHKQGLSAFLQSHRTHKPSELWVYSPYWADVSSQVAAFDADRTVLVPALRRDGAALGLTRDQAVELDANTMVRRNEVDAGTRFWHMKAYRIQHGELTRTAVGSCNFTRAGLAGGDGNVEAMLVFDDLGECLPSTRPIQDKELGEETQVEEETPEPAPVAIVVAWDWRKHKWCWWLDPAPRQSDFALHLPGLTPFAIRAGVHERSGRPPARGATFMVSYRTQEGGQQWEGQVVELNLDYSARSYGRPLTVNDILESWSSRAPTWAAVSGGNGGDASELEVELEGGAPSAFDAVNLYDLYRAMGALRVKLKDLEQRPDIQRAYLVGRPDSVMALAHLADRDGAAPVVRYLVLRELCGVCATWAHRLDQDLMTALERMAEKARARTQAGVLDQLGGDTRKAQDLLDWFEQALRDLDSGLPA